MLGAKQLHSLRQFVIGTSCALALSTSASTEASAGNWGGAKSNTFWLNQGWSAFDRDWYYFQSQGSEILSYTFFLNLEQADNHKLFRDNRHLADLGFTVVPPSANNPHGLPIGFTRDAYQDKLGMNCAACHNGEITYKDKRIIVDGGVALSDFPEFNKRLAAALTATLNDDAKFERFARRMLKEDFKPDNVQALRRDLAVEEEKRRTFVKRQYTGELAAGHGRLDAIVGIFNQALSMTGVPNNRIPITAPTSYPHIWDTMLMDFVQYDGDVGNAGIGSLLRNVGEVVGVYGRIEGTKKLDLKKGYPSSIRMHDLAAIESTLKRLSSPKWPASFPAIDEAKAERGQKHYAKHCASCHQVIDGRDPDRRIVRPFYRPEEIGTDTARLVAVGATAPMGIFAGRKEGFTEGRTLETKDYVVALLDHLQAGAVKANAPAELTAEIAADAPFKKDHKKTGTYKPSTAEKPLQEFWAYGARPLNGIWATAPYLNNGSVPNLQQLLLPASERVRSFHVKSKEFDPVNVGFSNKPVSGAFVFDTSKPGNRNTGHEFGTKLGETERWELIEYLKTL